jgi:hypothetical protein
MHVHFIHIHSALFDNTQLFLKIEFDLNYLKQGLSVAFTRFQKVLDKRP